MLLVFGRADYLVWEAHSTRFIRPFAQMSCSRKRQHRVFSPGY